MEYVFELGTFPYLSLSEIINVLESENIPFKVKEVTLESLHIEIEQINPEIFLDILGGTRSIYDVFHGKTYKQNIKAYTKREFQKPVVDAKSGLLPVKLAKMMVNLSFTKDRVKLLYDPFCGGGTISNEANLMGIKTIGSDIDKRTIQSAQKNAAWLSGQYHIPETEHQFFVMDVRELNINLLKQKKIDAIVTEPFLGKPLTAPLKLNNADKQNMDSVNAIITESLLQFSSILETGKRAIIIIPCFRTSRGLQKLEISKTFNKYSFKKVDLLKDLYIDKAQELLYFRPRAFVLREIFILEKI